MSKKNGAWDARRVRAIRIAFGETQESFARRVGVSFVSVNRWENGRTVSPMAVKRLEALEAEIAKTPPRRRNAR